MEGTSGTGGCEPKRERQIASGINYSKTVSAELNDVVSGLEDRLAAVLTAVPPEGPSNEETKSPELVGLASEIRVSGGMVQSSVFRLKSILARLEL